MDRPGGCHGPSQPTTGPAPGADKLNGPNDLVFGPDGPPRYGPLARFLGSLTQIRVLPRSFHRRPASCRVRRGYARRSCGSGSRRDGHEPGAARSATDGRLRLAKRGASCRHPGPTSPISCGGSHQGSPFQRSTGNGEPRGVSARGPTTGSADVTTSGGDGWRQPPWYWLTLALVISSSGEAVKPDGTVPPPASVTQ